MLIYSIRRDQKSWQDSNSLHCLVQKKKGGGKLIVKYLKIKKSNHLNRLITLSPLTDMAKELSFKKWSNRTSSK